MRATTSASNLHRRKLCPGSQRMEHGLPEHDSPYSSEGTLLHEWFLKTGGRPPELTEEQNSTIDKANALANDFFKSFAQTHGIADDEPCETLFEQELEIVSGELVMTGHADVIKIWQKIGKAAIVDAKFGRGDVDDADDNLQLASYAVMLAERRCVFILGVCIVQPRNFKKPTSEAVYDVIGLSNARLEIVSILHASKAFDAELIPSEKACRYCKATLNCHALIGKVMTLRDYKPLTHNTTPHALAVLDDERLSLILDTIKLANRLELYAKDEASRRVEAGQMTEWEFKKGYVVNCVTDAIKAYTLLLDVVPGLHNYEYMAACKLSLTHLEVPVAKHLNISQAEAKRVILKAIEPVIERVENSPFIVRKKQK